MPLHLITGQKGVKHLAHQGYIYIKDKPYISRHSRVLYWRCSMYKESCLGRLKTSFDKEELKDNEIIGTTNFHNHGPDPARIEASTFIQNLKEVCITSTDRPRNIIAAACSTLKPSVAGIIQPVQNLSRTINRKRKLVLGFPVNPRNLVELVLQDSFTMIKNKGNNTEKLFLQYDSANDPAVPLQERLIIFGTSNTLQMLSNSAHWFCDGTFKTTPPLFDQLYTIHSLQNNIIYPCIYILMTQRTTGHYQRILQFLKSSIYLYQPESILMDFELAALNAFEIEFPNAQRRGCYFHFNQALWRKIESIPEMLQKYSDDSDYALNVKQVAALAFLPTDHVVKGFEFLQTHEFFIDNPETTEFMDYFEGTWIGKLLPNNQRRAPRYPLGLWNCYQATIDNIPRTNNSLESWNGSFNNLTGLSHPQIHPYIEAIKKDYWLTQLKVSQNLAGTPTFSQKKSVKRNQTISSIVSGFTDLQITGNFNLDKYLHGLAFSVKF